MGDCLTSVSDADVPARRHGQRVPSSTTVTLGGDPIVLATDTFTVAGCPFTLGRSPHPCVQVQWVVAGAASARADGDAAADRPTASACAWPPTGAVQGTGHDPVHPDRRSRGRE